METVWTASPRRIQTEGQLHSGGAGTQYYLPNYGQYYCFIRAMKRNITVYNCYIRAVQVHNITEYNLGQSYCFIRAMTHNITEYMQGQYDCFMRAMLYNCFLEGNITDSTSVSAGTSITVYNQGRCNCLWGQYNFFWCNIIFSWRAIILLSNTYSHARIFCKVCEILIIENIYHHCDNLVICLL